MATTRIPINRAPVLTLWAVVVAERLGHDHQAALTFGKCLAGLNAQSKGRRLGIYKESADTSTKPETKKPRAQATPDSIALLGRQLPVTRTSTGVRALSGDEVITPESVDRYLGQKFGDRLPDVRQAMQALAAAFTPAQLETRGFALYEKFRPTIPEGKKGWGAKGELDLNLIRSLAK
jgi:hypothetical protein